MGSSISIHQAKKVDVGKREGRENRSDVQEIEIQKTDGDYFSINIFFD